MTDQPTTPPAGWYADPDDTGDLRWWDGREWTSHTHADPAATTVDPTLDPTPAATPTPSPAPAPDAGSDVPWWAQSSGGKPPSWWDDGTADQRAAWDASQAVGDRLGPADPRTFGVPGATPESGAAPVSKATRPDGARSARWRRRRGADPPRTP